MTVAGYRIIGVISCRNKDLIKTLMDNGFELYTNPLDSERIDVYSKDK